MNTTPLFANILCTLNTEDDVVLFRACVKSIADVVHGIVILDTTPADSPYKVKEVLTDIGAVYSYMYDPSIIETEGFAAARNKMLGVCPDGSYILWVDSDEVHFPEQLLQLKQLLQASNGSITDISTHFIHFCVASNFYERFEHRINLFQKLPGTRWENKVHEKLVHTSPRQVYNSDYAYMHFGYARGQEYVFKRWYQYALLEGQKTPYVGEEENGVTVPYFRGERSGPDKILEDRKKTLLPYFGPYPSALSREWIKNKAVTDI